MELIDREVSLHLASSLVLHFSSCILSSGSEEDEDDVGSGEGEEEEESQPMDQESDSDGEDLPVCPICLDKLRNQDIGAPESCDHQFCLECIIEWSRVRLSSYFYLRLCQKVICNS